MSSSSPPPSIDAPSLPLDHPLSQVSAPASPVVPVSVPVSVSAAEAEVLNDPPPPYPSPRVRRARGTRSNGNNRRASGAQRTQQLSQHSQIPSNDSDNTNDHEASAPQRSPRTSLHLHTVAVDSTDATETTPLLGSGSSTSGPLLRPRPRSIDQASMISFAPSLASLAHTAWAFLSECDSDEEYGEDSRCHAVESSDNAEGEDGGQRPLEDGSSRGSSTGSGGGFFSTRSWARYFRPVSRAVYWRSLAHLVLINFPFALAAWVYLFVFTVTGTTLLILLPLGALLCFFDLLGARAFSRAELFLQTKFHNPLHYPLSVLQATASSRAPSISALIANYPIFTRPRQPTASELESGQAVVGEVVIETSFYKNTNSMFTDSTTFQALFYFLVIKPAIVLLFTLFFLVICVPLLVLVIPAPVALRACRRIGRWQAVVAVEGLIVGVR